MTDLEEAEAILARVSPLSVDPQSEPVVILSLPDRDKLLAVVRQFRAERVAVPPLVAYMRAESGPERDVAFLRVYADKVEQGTATAWEKRSPGSSIE